VELYAYKLSLSVYFNTFRLYCVHLSPHGHFRSAQNSFCLSCHSSEGTSMSIRPLGKISV
jgi:hypothetical protein